MAFAIRDLSVLAYAQGFTLWHYKAGADPLRAIAAPDFFNTAADMLASGDMLLVSGPRIGQALFVTATDGAITTAPLGG